MLATGATLKTTHKSNQIKLQRTRHPDIVLSWQQSVQVRFAWTLYPASISIQSATPFLRACYFLLSLKGPSKDGPFSTHHPPRLALARSEHRRNQASTGAKRRCEPWYQPWGVMGAPFLKRAFLLVS